MHKISLLLEFEFFDVSEIELFVFSCKGLKMHCFPKRFVNSPPYHLYLLLLLLDLPYKKAKMHTCYPSQACPAL